MWTRQYFLSGAIFVSGFHVVNFPTACKLRGRKFAARKQCFEETRADIVMRLPSERLSAKPYKRTPSLMWKVAAAAPCLAVGAQFI